MRAITATEKLRAVNEGQMSPKEFVRQMRQQFPQHITQFNGFKDSVQILKNKGLVFETKVEVKEEAAPAAYAKRQDLNYSLDALDRGIRIELEAKGITPEGGKIKPEDFFEAEKKAKANLEKNATHYLDLISGESKNVDKHDKEVEVKKDNHVDIFNGLKKAALKEGYTESQIHTVIENLKEKTAAYMDEDHYDDLTADDTDLPTPELKAYVAKMYRAIVKGASIQQVDKMIVGLGKLQNKAGIKEEQIEAAIQKIRERKGAQMNEEKELDDVYGDGDVVVNITGMDPGMKAVWEIEKEISEFEDSDDAQMVVDNMIEIGSEEHLISYLEDRGIDTGTIVHMVKAYNSASANEEKISEDEEEDARNDADYEAGWADDPRRDESTNIVKEAGKTALIKTMNNAIAAIKGKYGEMPGITGIIRDFLKTHIDDLATGADPLDEFENYIDANYDSLSEEAMCPHCDMPKADCKCDHVDEKKGKDHDGDGDIDGDDYKHAKDKAIKKAMGKELSEGLTVVGHTPEEQLKNAEELVATAKKAGRDAKIKYDGDRIVNVDIGAPGLRTPDEVQAVQDRQFADYRKNKPKDTKPSFKAKKLKKLTKGGKTYEVGDFDPNDDGRIESIEKYPNGYYIRGGVYSDYGDGDAPKEEYGYAIDLKGNEMDEEDLEGMYEGKAIKKAMSKEEQLKEAVKSIIMKTLTEGNLNEAATAKLSDWGEGYEGFEGVKAVVNELENIVTEVEQFYDKIGDKIAKTFAKTANFRNEEGLKIGAFIAPSLEAAFNQDLRPVIKKGFTQKVELPQVKRISQQDIDNHNAGLQPLGELESDEPKKTVFSPNI